MPPTTIVLLHGQPDFSASFWPLRTALQGRLGAGVNGAGVNGAGVNGAGVNIVVPDRPGYGANFLDVADFEGNADWLDALLADIGAERVVVVGHSWAGGVAILSAARRHQQVAAIVLLSSIGPHCLLPIDPWLAKPVLGDIIAFAMLRLARKLVIRKAVGPLRDGLGETDRPYARAGALAMTRRPVWRSFVAEQRFLIRQLPIIEAALAAVSLPSLIVSGTADTMIPAATPEALAAQLAGSVHIAIAGGGHDLHLRRTAEVAEQITLFLRPILDGKSEP